MGHWCRQASAQGNYNKKGRSLTECILHQLVHNCIPVSLPNQLSIETHSWPSESPTGCACVGTRESRSLVPRRQDLGHMNVRRDFHSRRTPSSPRLVHHFAWAHGWGGQLPRGKTRELPSGTPQVTVMVCCHWKGRMTILGNAFACWKACSSNRVQGVSRKGNCLRIRAGLWVSPKHRSDWNTKDIHDEISRGRSDSIDWSLWARSTPIRLVCKRKAHRGKETTSQIRSKA